MTHLVKQRSIFKGNVRRDNQYLIVSAGNDGKVGATAGWTVNNAADTNYANLPASQTSSTLVVTLPPIKPNQKITGFHLLGGINSAGGSVSISAVLRKSVAAAAATPTDTTIATMTTVNATASTILNAANTQTTGITESISDVGIYFITITGTTAASTSIHIEGVVLEIQEI